MHRRVLGPTAAFLGAIAAWAARLSTVSAQLSLQWGKEERREAREKKEKSKKKVLIGSTISNLHCGICS